MEVLLQGEMKGLSDYLDVSDYVNACNDASRETGWSFPTSSDFRTHWMKQRAKRHLFFYLLSQSAHKFKYQQVNLQQRFDHYERLVKYMDEAYLAAMESNPDEWAGVEAFRIFGTKVDAGFAYDEVGKDLTYDSDQLVEFQPKEDD